MGRNQQGEGAEKRCVQHDLDTLITARYVEVDDLFIGLGVRQGPGRPSRLTDAELVCLAVAQVLLGFHSERRWLRFAEHRLGHLFPDLPQQPADNRRLRAAARLLARAIRHLAGLTPSWWDRFRLLDSTPVPCGASRETVKGSPGSPSGPVSGHPIGASSDGDPSMGCPSRASSGSKPTAGVPTWAVRVAQRLLALTAGVWPHWLIEAPDKRSLVAYDH